MIKNIKHRGLKRFFNEGDHRGLDPKHIRKIRRIMTSLNTAKTVDAMAIPGFNLHELKGDRKGTWTVKVSGNMRITFTFENGDAYNVNYEDYH